jgi:hypothetical protein
MGGSPCIDEGDNSAVPPDITLDLQGNLRIQNRIVDMGAYEHTPGTFCESDVAPKGGGNGVVDIDDLLLVINGWGQSPPNPGDVNGDSLVNIDDLLMVVNAWGVCP